MVAIGYYSPPHPSREMGCGQPDNNGSFQNNPAYWREQRTTSLFCTVIARRQHPATATTMLSVIHAATLLAKGQQEGTDTGRATCYILFDGIVPVFLSCLFNCHRISW
jgi:hypothetical protein